eukprot:6455131-Amphidinium_carterae.1
MAQIEVELTYSGDTMQVMVEAGTKTKEIHFAIANYFGLVQSSVNVAVEKEGRQVVYPKWAADITKYTVLGKKQPAAEASSSGAQ